MNIDRNIIHNIISGNGRFVSVFEDPDPYYLYSSLKPSRCDFEEKDIALFYEKLKYAVSNYDKLILGMFRSDFYEFYGVNRNMISTPEQMRDNLIFDSFTMDTDRESVGVCFTNKKIMPGHFIEVHWDKDWNLGTVWID